MVGGAEDQGEGGRDESVILFAHSFSKAGQSSWFNPLTLCVFSARLSFPLFQLYSSRKDRSHVTHLDNRLIRFFLCEKKSLISKHLKKKSLTSLRCSNLVMKRLVFYCCALCTVDIVHTHVVPCSDHYRDACQRLMNMDE